jgi:hypothetical protein
MPKGAPEMTQNPFQSPPPGLLGELADFIYRAAMRPVPEFAIAGAIAFLAGITGRAFNVYGTGLNQYVIAIAGTGRGKEGPRSGVQQFCAYAKSGVWHDKGIPNQTPTLDEFMGPAEISSGQALLKHFVKQRSFVTFAGEFGHVIERMCHPRASSSDIMLRRVLLDVFMLSGQHKRLEATIYSDKVNNTDAVISPSFSLFGETSPEALYPHLDERMVALGLLPRFLPIIYSGIRVPLNVDGHKAVPSVATMEHFASLVQRASELNSHNVAFDVPIAPGAFEFIGARGYVDSLADSIINEATHNTVVAEMWNRAHLKALKLAALVAVGRNHIAPEISLTDAEWSFAVVKHGIEAICAKFEAGEIGDMSQADNVQHDTVRMAIREWIERPWDEIKKYGVPDEELHRIKFIPWSFISKRVSGLSVFVKGGKTKAIHAAVNELVDCGEIQLVGPYDRKGLTDSEAKLYRLGDDSTLRQRFFSRELSRQHLRRS